MSYYQPFTLQEVIKMSEATILIIAVMLFNIVFFGPTIYHDWKVRKKVTH